MFEYATMDKDEQMAYLHDWLELSLTERDQRGLPRTQDDLAALMQVSSKTLRRWPESTGYRMIQANAAKRRNRLRELPMTNVPFSTKLAAPLPSTAPQAPSVVADADDQETDDLGLDDGDLEKAWRRLAATDIQAAKFYWASWGKAKADAAARANDIKYDQETLEALVAQSLELLGPESLVTYLAANGWRVEKVED